MGAPGVCGSQSGEAVTNPDIHAEKFHIEMDTELEGFFEQTINADIADNHLLATCSETLPQPTVLTMDDIREAMYKCGFPIETEGERCIRRLREMGFEMRVVDPKPLFTITTA